MTVTYNGSKITTDTLYEDGTIQVKKGFVTGLSKPGQTTTYQINEALVKSSRKRTMIKMKDDAVFDENPLMYSEAVVKSSRKRTMIKMKDDAVFDENPLMCSDTIIKSARKKVTIITP